MRECYGADEAGCTPASGAVVTAWVITLAVVGGGVSPVSWPGVVFLESDGYLIRKVASTLRDRQAP